MKKKNDDTKKSVVQLSNTLYADKETYDKVHKHLSDINDTISEEDIENVSTDIVVTNTHEYLESESSDIDKSYNGLKRGEALSAKQEKKMYDEGEKINSPWNILSE